MASFGETLKRERESRNISLREIAETTKINIRQLEALEVDRYAALPGGVFSRGFVRAYADYLGIDADTAVRDFLEALSASGVESNEGALPHPDRVAKNSAEIAGQTTIDSESETIASHPRISMGPSSEATAAADAGIRTPGPRRFMVIAFWVIVGGALLSGLFVMRSGRPASSPDLAVANQPQPPSEPNDGQELFEPPEGMFVDAGPAMMDDEGGADDSNQQDALQSEPMAAQPRRPAERRDQPPPSPPGAEPARVGIGAGQTPAPPPAAQPKTAAVQRSNSVKTADPPEPDRAIKPRPALSPPPVSELKSPPPGPLSLEVDVTRETWLWLSCDSDTRIDRRVRPGEATAMQCLRSIRVSAHDAGAIRLRVNGADCMPLGDDGARVYGYTIRFDDAHLICRTPSRTR